MPTIHKLTHIPICPYCNKLSNYVDSQTIYGKSYGMIYHCKDCDAYCGCHPGTNVPLGTLANKSLRLLRIKTHEAFDQLWKDGFMKRQECYDWLAKTLGKSKDDTHIGCFREKDCQDTITISQIKYFSFYDE